MWNEPILPESTLSFGLNEGAVTVRHQLLTYWLSYFGPYNHAKGPGSCIILREISPVPTGKKIAMVVSPLR